MLVELINLSQSHVHHKLKLSAPHIFSHCPYLLKLILDFNRCYKLTLCKRSVGNCITVMNMNNNNNNNNNNKTYFNKINN